MKIGLTVTVVWRDVMYIWGAGSRFSFSKLGRGGGGEGAYIMYTISLKFIFQGPNQVFTKSKWWL